MRPFVPSRELQQVIDIQRDALRRQFMKDGRSIEQLLEEAAKRKLYINNAYQDTDGFWRVFCRYSANGRLADSAYGACLGEAIFHAIERAKRSGYKGRDLPPPAKNELPGSGKTQEELSDYCGPKTREDTRDTSDIPAAFLSGNAGVSADAFPELPDEDDDPVGSGPAAEPADDDLSEYV